jgi:hypothetical protein
VSNSTTRSEAPSVLAPVGGAAAGQPRIWTFLGFEAPTIDLRYPPGQLSSAHIWRSAWRRCRALIPAAGYITIIVPIIVFLSLQRFFIRGMTSGAVKG